VEIQFQSKRAFGMARWRYKWRSFAFFSSCSRDDVIGNFYETAIGRSGQIPMQQAYSEDSVVT
jgi:hypothetical protein